MNDLLATRPLSPLSGCVVLGCLCLVKEVHGTTAAITVYLLSEHLVRQRFVLQKQFVISLNTNNQICKKTIINRDKKELLWQYLTFSLQCSTISPLHAGIHWIQSARNAVIRTLGYTVGIQLSSITSVSPFESECCQSFTGFKSFKFLFEKGKAFPRYRYILVVGVKCYYLWSLNNNETPSRVRDLSGDTSKLSPVHVV